MGSLYNLTPFMGDITLIKVLMLVILAGVGSFNGIFYVGALLGVLYGALPVVLPGAMVDAVGVDHGAGATGNQAARVLRP